MEKLLRKNDRPLIAGAGVLAGNAILRSFQKSGYGQKEIGREILTPSRKELNYLDSDEVKKWLKINNPDIAAGKVGRIYVNMIYTSKGIKKKLKIIKDKTKNLN